MARMSLTIESEEQLYQQDNATGVVFIKTGKEEMVSFEFHRAKNGKLYVTHATKPSKVVTELEWLSRQITKRADAYDAGYANGLRDGKVQSEYFAVLETCKYDMKEEFEASPKIQLEIEQFTDEQMRAIAGNIRIALTEGYWVALRKAVEEELNAR